MRSLLIAILVTGTGLSLTSQDAVFRSNTQTVPIFATVIDAERRLVPSLDKSAFTILDNGKPQEITFFLNEIQPFTAVIMLDTSLTMTANIRLLRAAAEQFLIRMLPEDKGQVGAFNDKIQFSGEFTSHRDELIGALKELQFGNPTKTVQNQRNPLSKKCLPPEAFCLSTPNAARIIFDQRTWSIQAQYIVMNALIFEGDRVEIG